MSEEPGEARIEAFWRSYLDTLPPDSPTREESYEAEMFGDTMKLADELGALILSGVKTATCSELWEYEAESEPLPKVGQKTVILDGRGHTLCVIETTEVEVRPYDEVDADFASCHPLLAVGIALFGTRRLLQGNDPSGEGVVDSFSVAACQNVRIGRSRLYEDDCFRGYAASGRRLAEEFADPEDKPHGTTSPG